MATTNIVFYEGFEYKGFRFGWKAEKLYRLPEIKNNRRYSLKEVPMIKYSTKSIEGYRIMRDRKSLWQLIELTTETHWTVSKPSCKECPKIK